MAGQACGGGLTAPHSAVAMPAARVKRLSTRRHVTSHVPTVLLVEGHQDNRAMYAEYLRTQRFRTVEIDNTADALALAPATDVIVTVRGEIERIW